MDYSTYKKHTFKQLKNRKGVALREIKSRGGTVIEKGETVTFHGKASNAFHVTGEKNNSYIRFVDYSDINLLDDSQ